MIDLSTINASTIAQPQTLDAVRDEVREIQSLGDVSRANVVLSYLQRQLPQTAGDPVRSNYSDILRQLHQLVGHQSASMDGELTTDERTRVAVRDRSGKVQLFSHGHFQDEKAQQQQLRRRPSTPPDFRQSIGNVQHATESTAEQKSVPVAFDLPEDEEEIRAHSNRLSSLRLTDQHNIEAAVMQLMQKHQLAFADEQLTKRFHTVAVSRLKDIRNDREVKEILTRSPKVGGLGLSPEKADAVVHDLQNGALAVESDLTDIHPQKKHGTPQPTPPAPSMVLRTKSPQSAQVPVREEKIPIPPPAPATLPKAPRKVMPVRQAARPGSRPTIDDIKSPAPVRRLIGPVEELQHLSLEDFRSWGATPADAVRKVYEKIGVLGQESFGKRVEGVHAWRESPVHKLYLAVSRESLEKGTDISQVVKNWQQQQKPVLTEAEFHAIVDLNTKLRF